MGQRCDGTNHGQAHGFLVARAHGVNHHDTSPAACPGCPDGSRQGCSQRRNDEQTRRPGAHWQLISNAILAGLCHPPAVWVQRRFGVELATSSAVPYQITTQSRPPWITSPSRGANCPCRSGDNGVGSCKPKQTRRSSGRLCGGECEAASQSPCGWMTDCLPSDIRKVISS